MIDIIIPAYNAHNTIEKTLLSIVMQNICDKVKVYIVNDNSEQNYSLIIKKFENFLNIKELVLKENKGPGYARQYGIDNSNSEYIFFIDADDVLYDCFSLNNLYCLRDNYDVIIGQIYDEKNNSIYVHQGCLHGKLYRREFLEKNNIRFNDSRNHEDHSFNQLCLLSNSNVVYSNDIIYYYYYYEKSESKKAYSNYDLDSMYEYVENIKWVLDLSIDRKYDKSKIANLVFNSVCYLYSNYCYNINLDDSNIILRESKKLYDYYVKYEKLIDIESKKMIYYNFVGQIIPPISLNEFILKINSLK